MIGHILDGQGSDSCVGGIVYIRDFLSLYGLVLDTGSL
jgi:hypothetical protein